MQQLISTTTTTAATGNPPTPIPPLVTSPFHSEEMRDIYIPNGTLHETEPAQVFSRPPVHVKPKAPSMDTLYNKEFSCTTRGEEEASRLAPPRRPQPVANPFGFSDYPPTTIMITRNLGTNCRTPLTAKKIVVSKPLSTICTR
uniref:Uncharacterized protein n=1 Tax=Romanomermis culicivorax TaxID=13658 RepID=A0A915JYP3_ROMCU